MAEAKNVITFETFYEALNPLDDLDSFSIFNILEQHALGWKDAIVGCFTIQVCFRS